MEFLQPAPRAPLECSALTGAQNRQISHDIAFPLAVHLDPAR
jgi:hypothetical protein